MMFLKNELKSVDFPSDYSYTDVVLLDCVHFSLIGFCEQATLGKGKNYQVNVNILIVIFRSKFDIFLKKKKVNMRRF